jgi:hypothetical protein
MQAGVLQDLHARRDADGQGSLNPDGREEIMDPLFSTPIPGAKQAAQKIASQVALSAAGTYKSVEESVSKIVDATKTSLMTLCAGVDVPPMDPGDEASIITLNGIVDEVSSQNRICVGSILSVEGRQLAEFNTTAQRAEEANRRLDEISKKLSSAKSDNAAQPGTVTFFEDLTSLSLIDQALTSPDMMPSLGSRSLMLGEDQTTDPSFSTDKTTITLERVSASGLGYPCGNEEPSEFIHEGRFFGFPGEAMPEGGSWHIDLQPKTSAMGDEFSAAILAISSMGVPKAALDKMVPPDITEQFSDLTAVNNGPMPTDLAKVRTSILDSNAETFWQCEYVFKTGSNKPIGRIKVSLLVQLDQTVRTGKLKLTPYLPAAGSRPSVDIEVGTDPSQLFRVPETGDYLWTFPAMDVKYIRITMEDTAAEVTPYPEMLVEFDRGISSVSTEKTVPR